MDVGKDNIQLKLSLLHHYGYVMPYLHGVSCVF